MTIFITHDSALELSIYLVGQIYHQWQGFKTAVSNFIKCLLWSATHVRPNSSKIIGYFIDETFFVPVVMMIMMWRNTHVVQGLQPGALLLWFLQHCQAPPVKFDGWKVARRPSLQRVTWPRTSNHSLASTQFPACTYKGFSEWTTWNIWHKRETDFLKIQSSLVKKSILFYGFT